MLDELKKYITSDIEIDSINIYSAYNKQIVLKHVQAVAKKASLLSRCYKVDYIKIKTAAYLHDISVVIPRKKYIQICKEYKIKVLDIENELPILLHQKISNIIAKEVFNIKDKDILSAISCHTTLKKNAAEFDKIIFISDKLAWDQVGEPPYKKIVETSLKESLESGCLAYIDFIIDNKMIIKPHPALIAARKWLRNYI